LRDITVTNNPTSVSLLYRVRDQTDQASWDEFAKLYYGLIQRWLKAQGVRSQDADDVAQEVMVFVSGGIGNFEHNGRQGAFRSWLRRVTSNRLREHWRKRDRRKNREGPDLGDMAEALADDRSNVSRVWNLEHDRFVLEYLLEAVTERFQESSLLAFRKIALDQRPAEEVADELGMSLGAVRVAQSRVLRALREIGGGLVD
jgi:RNA polymerase sigma-70 factor (ECF subfamily)